MIVYRGLWDLKSATIPQIMPIGTMTKFNAVRNTNKTLAIGNTAKTREIMAKIIVALHHPPNFFWFSINIYLKNYPYSFPDFQVPPCYVLCGLSVVNNDSFFIRRQSYDICIMQTLCILVHCSPREILFCKCLIFSIENLKGRIISDTTFFLSDKTILITKKS